MFEWSEFEKTYVSLKIERWRAHLDILHRTESKISEEVTPETKWKNYNNSAFSERSIPRKVI